MLMLFISIILLSTDASAQDAAFSQFYAAPIALNPALAGSGNCSRMGLNYRNQWPELSAAYVTYSISYDQHIDPLKGGIGFMATADRSNQGALSDYAIACMYAWHGQIGRDWTVSAAVQGGYHQLRVDWDAMVFEDQYNPITGSVMANSTYETPGVNAKGYADMATGIVAGYREKYYMGLAIHHLNEPDITLWSAGYERLPMKITAHFGAIIDITNGIKSDYRGKSWAISPNVLYQQQGNQQQVNAGVYLMQGILTGGVWYRHNLSNPDAIIFMCGIRHQSWRFGYSYDRSLGFLSNKSSGAHEISIGWNILCRDKKSHNRGAIKCPEF